MAKPVFPGIFFLLFFFSFSFFRTKPSLFGPCLIFSSAGSLPCPGPRHLGQVPWEVSITFPPPKAPAGASPARLSHELETANLSCCLHQVRRGLESRVMPTGARSCSLQASAAEPLCVSSSLPKHCTCTSAAISGLSGKLSALAQENGAHLTPTDQPHASCPSGAVRMLPAELGPDAGDGLC